MVIHFHQSHNVRPSSVSITFSTELLNSIIVRHSVHNFKPACGITALRVHLSPRARFSRAYFSNQSALKAKTKVPMSTKLLGAGSRSSGGPPAGAIPPGALSLKDSSRRKHRCWRFHVSKLAGSGGCEFLLCLWFLVVAVVRRFYQRSPSTMNDRSICRTSKNYYYYYRQQSLAASST